MRERGSDDQERGAGGQQEQSDAPRARRPASNAAVAAMAASSRAPAAVRKALANQGGGSPLARPLESELGRSFGADLSGVRVHTDATAARAASTVQARAFTVGSDIYMGPGQSAAAPTPTLVEEVAHTLQPMGAATSLVSDPGGAAEREASQASHSVRAGQSVDVGAPREAVLHRDAAGGSRIEELATLLDDGDEDGAISLMGSLSSGEVATVLGSARLRRLAIGTLDDEEMYRGVRAMGGDLWKSLDWMFGEGTSVEYVLDVINRCRSDAQKATVRNSTTMRSHFIDLCGNDEMARVTAALGGDLEFKLSWMLEEGSSWAVVRPLIVAASDAQKATVRSSTTMRSRFTSLLGNEEMRDCVQVLGGTLMERLDWMLSEGTNWASIRMVIESVPDESQRAAVRASNSMRDRFVSELDNDEMDDLVYLLGGDLKWKLHWMFAEGTSNDNCLNQIRRAPWAERTAVTQDTWLRDQFVSLLNDDEMQTLVQYLSNDLLFKVDWLIAEGTTWAAIKTHIQNAAEPEKAAVRASAVARERFVSLLGNDEMAEAVDLLGGDLRFKLDWMFEEGTSWAVVKAKIEAADEAGRAGVRRDPAMRGHFVSLLGNDEMAEAVGLLGGDLRFKLDWMLEEGTNWGSVRALIEAAPEGERAIVRGSTVMRDGFVSLLGNDEMAEAVGLLGGDLRFKLDWMFAEGTSWSTVRPLIEAAPEAERAAVRTDRAMRGHFVSLLGNDEMRTAVDLLGGDLRFKLEWMMEEGTDWSIVRAMIEAASEADKASVRRDRGMRDRFVSLLDNDEMAVAVDLLSGDLHFELDWMFAEGTDWAAVKTRVEAAPDSERALVRRDSAMRGEFVSLLGNDEMAEAVDSLGGDLHFKLSWMFAEGTDWGTVKAKIEAADEAGKAAVRRDPAMRGEFVSLLGNEEMGEAVSLLGGDLAFKLSWTMEEGTEWSAVRALIDDASEAERAVVRATMRGAFVSLLGNDEMAEAVDALGGDLRFKLDWMFEEGTDWATVKAKIESADESGKAAVRRDPSMRGHFVSLLGNEEMGEAVTLLGGDLAFKLSWTMEEGTDWAAVRALIDAAPESERAVVRATMRAEFVSLLGNDEMVEAVDALGGDLRFKLSWMFEEGTDWATVRAKIEASDDAGKAAVRTDPSMRAHFVSLLGNEEMAEAVSLLGGDLAFKLAWTMEEGTDWAAVRALIDDASESERAVVRATMRAQFVALLGNDEMAEAVDALGGDLRFKLDWMFEEGADWAAVKTKIEAADEAGRAGVRTDPSMRGHFVSLLGNEEMAEAVTLLGGDLMFKLEWTMEEGTDWASVHALILAASESERAAVRESAAMKGRFIDLLGNDEMRDAVTALGGDLLFRLSWMLAEGTSWPVIREELESADAAGKARVRGDLGMRGWFVENLGDVDMATAVQLLDGDLRFELTWTLAEGTTWEAVRTLIEAAPDAERTAAVADHEVLAQLTALCTQEQMRDALDLLGAPLAIRVEWMLQTGTDDASLRAIITAATPEEQMGLIASPHLGAMLAVIEGSAIDAFSALSDPARLATAMRSPLMVRELTEKPANDVLTLLAGNPVAAAAALEHMNDSLSWMSPLPARGGLSTEQRTNLRVLYDNAPRVTQRWALFERRFGADLSGRWNSTIAPGDLGRLWTLLDRLPESQIEDNEYIDDLVRHFRGGGTYGGGTINIGSDDNPEGFYVPEGWKTKADIAAVLGISEADVDARVTSGLIEQRTINGNVVYRVMEGGYSKADMAALLGITEAEVDALAASSVLLREGSRYKINHAEWRTGPDMAAHLGITEAQLAARVTAGQLVQATLNGVVKYATRRVIQSYFDHTVLHEVGHAVDDMLGNHTDITYNWAGWEKFGEGDVRTWANHMNGWGAAKAGDDLEDVKSAICDVMDDYMDKSTDIPAPATDIGADLDANHVWKRYSDWPIVQWAGTKMFHYRAPHFRDDGSHVYSANFYYQKWMRAKSSALQNLPRDYSRFAPEEWFADAYAEYYRQYDGTPATEHLKGGNLPGHVKQWFDTHVDNLGHTPQEETDGGSAPTPSSGVVSGRR